MKTIEGGITDRLMEIKNKIFCRNVYKNAKEKLSLGFWVTKIKNDTAGACFPNSWGNQLIGFREQGCNGLSLRQLGWVAAEIIFFTFNLTRLGCQLLSGTLYTMLP